MYLVLVSLWIGFSRAPPPYGVASFVLLLLVRSLRVSGALTLFVLSWIGLIENRVV